MNEPAFYLERSIQRLTAAEALMQESGLEADAINRLYYAALESTKAALAHLGKEIPRTHNGATTHYGSHSPQWSNST